MVSFTWFLEEMNNRNGKQLHQQTYIVQCTRTKKDYTNTMDMKDAYTQLHLLKIYVPYYKIQTTQQHLVCTLF